MAEPVYRELSADRLFTHLGEGSQCEQRTRVALFGWTLIRHAPTSGAVTAISGGVHGATTRSCLIASPSLPLAVAASVLRAGSGAVDLASVAPATDKDLRAAASTQKHSARHFIRRVRQHTNLRPAQILPAFSPDPIEHAAVLEAVKVRPGNAGVRCYRGVTADLDSFCARRRRKSAVGAEECSRRGSNQRMEPTERKDASIRTSSQGDQAWLLRPLPPFMRGS